MVVQPAHRELVIGMSPLGEPNARVAASVSRAGGLGVLDLGAGTARAREALELASQWSPGEFGVRVPYGCRLSPQDLRDDVSPQHNAAGPHTVILGWNAPWPLTDLVDHYRVLVEVTSRDEAVRAARAGAHGLIARGHEAGGRVGELSSFVLLQQLMAEEDVRLPVWLCGGIGLHTAAAAVIGGAAGVVLDTQLALLPECELPEEIASAIRASDGSDTLVVGGHRVLRRRGAPHKDIAAADADIDVAAGLAAVDHRSPLLPIGQDAFLAKQFADRFGNVGRAVRGVRAAVLAAVAEDPSRHTASALRPGSSLCQATGTELPIAQGPMTRVSDRAEFAASVAEHGGLPFIALALASQSLTRELLEQARLAVGDRPWGVGVLGFAPEDVRSAQLDVIRELRPPYVIIAGGRPAQAAALEKAGIQAFLHVPSPGLLRQFLDSGARRFIFEGSECGGHIGPRASFPLWEAQITVLLDYLTEHADDERLAERIQLFFAGGVHDARSAAMVAAAAAPLTERGVGIGVLMGSAYLFTEEIVRDSAVRPVFQRQLLSAEHTELLETAPGHATRGVTSPFMREFESLKRDLRARSLPDRDVWEALEQANVGRLRIASKGVRRQGADLVEVDEAEQVADGLFMAGQVAVLRSSVTTIEKLHRSVTDGASDFLTERARLLRERLDVPEAVAAPETARPVDVAIIGMACVFPQAPDLATYWANVLGGVDAVTEVPQRRWDHDVYYAQAPEGHAAGERTPSKWGGFLPEIPFDPLRYGIPPSSLASIEPVQLLALEVADRALTDAGYRDGGLDHSRTSVVFGAEAGSDLSNATVLRTVLPSYLGQVPAQLDEQLPKLTEDSFPGMLANVISGRIANRLDLGGANYTVDAACASSLAAVDVACKELVGRTSDLVLCGGADLHNGINDYLLFSSVQALSPTGRSRPFDSSADGIALGEGVACVVLKRLADAERDGDRIYAVIKGVGSASDGKSLGLTAPRPEGQRRALQRAYGNAGVSPAEVGLIEAHGTGTVVGDRTELASLSTLFTEAGAAEGSCVLGSVKSQIGHTKCAAGLAGLIKAAMAVHTGTKPPTLHVSQPNPGWQPESSPFVFSSTARPWAAPAPERVAGVSAFGFGGTNFHVVVRGHDAGPAPAHGADEWPAELFTFRGADHRGACRAIEWLLDLIRTNDSNGRVWRLRDLAKTTARRTAQRAEPVQVAVVATSIDDLTDQLRRAVAGEHDPTGGVFLATDDLPAHPGKLAMLFPGQGSQYPGMLADLFVAFPELQHVLQLGRRWADDLFPPAAFGADAEREQQARLRDTRVAQPALGITGLAVHHLLTRLDVRPDMLAGHSYGELVALCAAGSFDAATLLTLSAARADAILSALGTDPGTMAAVAATADEVDVVLRAAGLAEQVVIANHNAPRQVVISGPTGLVERAVTDLRAGGRSAKKIPVACAFHSPLLAGAGAKFAPVLAEHRIRPPEHVVWSNRTAAQYSEEPSAVRAELAAQLGAPVRFVTQIESMYAAGARVFVEAGPGVVLSRLVDAILGDRPHVTVSCDDRTAAGLRGFLAAIAQLAVAGVPLHTGWLFSGRDARDVGDAHPPKRAGWTIDGQLVRTADGGYLAGGLVPPRRVQEALMTRPSSKPDLPAPDTGREALISEFLRTGREIVAAQRDVLLSLLGAAPATPLQHTAAIMPAAAPLQHTAAAMPVAALPASTQPALSRLAESDRTPVAEPVPAPQPATVDVLGTVLTLIGERTGYPAEMIEPELDLEADLSIDSIKRTEIAGELLTRFAQRSTGTADADLDALAALRTTRAIADWLEPRVNGAAAAPQPARDDSAPTVGVPPKRFLVEPALVQDLDTADPATLAGTSLVIVGGAGMSLTNELAAQLTACGASVVIGSAEGPPPAFDDHVDGVLYLDPLATSPTQDEEPALPEAVTLFQAMLARGPRWLLAVAPRPAATPALSRFIGLRGLFRSIAREYPQTTARLVEVDPAADPARTARLLVGELLANDSTPVVLAEGTTRMAPRMTQTPLGFLGSVGAGPATDGASEAAAIGLDHDSVVLLVGGARGITAQFAATLVTASGCRVELVGRTPLPTEPEHPTISAATDLTELRAALISLGHGSPAEIERHAGRILAQREVAATIEELRTRSGSVRYHCGDVRDRDVIARVVKEVYAEHGRLDGVVYAAGIIEDRLLAEKDPESFARVFGTKVDGARALLSVLAEVPDVPRFVVLFGSIAAVLGNRGQSDYAAANDALESIGAAWAQRTGQRALTVHWGPWAPSQRHSGMVSPELGRSYAQRGIELIDPEEGVVSLLRELAWGDPALRSVVYTASGW